MPTFKQWARTTGVLGLVLIGALLLVACGGGATTLAPATVAQAPTAAPAAATDTAVPPTDTPAPTATLAPTDTPAPTATATEAPTPTAVPIPDASNCVACHTDEATLQQLAKAEEPTEKLSEGEG